MSFFTIMEPGKTFVVVKSDQQGLSLSLSQACNLFTIMEPGKTFVVVKSDQQGLQSFYFVQQMCLLQHKCNTATVIVLRQECMDFQLQRLQEEADGCNIILKLAFFTLRITRAWGHSPTTTMTGLMKTSGNLTP